MSLTETRAEATNSLVDYFIEAGIAPWMSYEQVDALFRDMHFKASTVDLLILAALVKLIREVQHLNAMHDG